MKQKKRTRMTSFFMLILVMGICSACSSNSTEEVSKEDMDNPVVQEDTDIPDADADEEPTKSQDKQDDMDFPDTGTAITPDYFPRYYNERCLYTADGENGVYQYSLNGKNEKHFDLNDGTAVIWVTDDWLYYVGLKDEIEKGTIWRIPLERQGNSETPSIDKKEKLTDIEIEKWGDFLDITEDYMAYTYKKSICRMDLNTKKIENISSGIKFSESEDYFPSMVTDAALNFFVKDGVTFFYDKNARMYRLDLKKGVCQKAAHIFQKNGLASRICSDKSHLYFGTSEEKKGRIIQYNIKNNAVKEILQGSDIEKLLKQENPWKYKENSAEWIAYPSFIYGDRLYLSIELMWEDAEEKANEDGMLPDPHFADLVISCKTDNGSELKYEKKLSECLFKYGKQVSNGDFDFGNWFDETGYIQGLMGDYAVMITTADTESDKFAWIFNNMKTNRSHFVKKDDKEYYLLYFLGENKAE